MIKIIKINILTILEQQKVIIYHYTVNFGILIV